MSQLRATTALRDVRRLYDSGTLAGLSDAALLERFHQGRDPVAFEALMARHGGMVLAVCRSVLGHGPGADDAFQATFLVLVRKAGSIRVDGSLGRWLHGVSRRVAVRAVKAESRRKSVEAAREFRGFAADDDALGRSEVAALLHAEIARLPASYRRAVVACYFEGLSHEDAAARLRWPIGTVKGRLARARDLLRDRLARKGVGVPATLIAATLAAEAASAGVGPSLRQATMRAAIGFAAGTKELAAGAVPAASVALAKGVLNTMTSMKIAAVVAGLVLSALAVESAVTMAGDQVGPSASTHSDYMQAQVSESTRPASSHPDEEDAKGAMTTRVYQVEDLVGPGAGGDRVPDFAPLMDLLRSSVTPGSWRVDAEAAKDKTSASMTPFVLNRGLIVRQTPKGHDELVERLRQIRRLLGVRDDGPPQEADHIVASPDILTVEVARPLPGRPIQGERLVRPDGTITLGHYGDVHVSGLTLKQVKEKVVIHLRKYLSDEALGLVDSKPRGGDRGRIDPIDSDRVVVDVASYNSHYYYVLGDVAAPGRLPITGNETVLDALQLVGGIMPEADTSNIRLVRPAPPGVCRAQELPVNLAAIMQAGDTTTNYKLKSGDRLFVYRKDREIPDDAPGSGAGIAKPSDGQKR